MTRSAETPKPRIIDNGRCPRSEGHRLTVMDAFYYLDRGYDFEVIHQAMPSVRRDEFDAVVEYVNEHRQELIEEDERIEEFHRRGREEQTRKGLDAFSGNESPEERHAILWEQLRMYQA